MKLIFAMGLLFSSMSLAGVMNGGGGKGVLCGHSVEALDLYESKLLFGLKEEPRRGSLRAEMQLGIDRLNYVWADPDAGRPPVVTPEYVLSGFFKKTKFLPAGQRLPFTNDATLPLLPLGCSFVQVAVYEDLHGISIDKEYWDLLDPRNQAAMILHEEIYFARRGYGPTNSDETRRFVGWALSTTPLTPRFGDKPKTGYYECIAGRNGLPIYDFYIYPSAEAGKQGYLMSFRQLVKPTTLGRATAFFESRAHFEEIKNPTATYAIEALLKSETHQDYRTLRLKKKATDRYPKITVIDTGEGTVTPEVEAICHSR